MDEDMLYDRRLLDRHVRSGRLEQEAVDKHLADLPDITDRAEVIDSQISSVGIANRDAEDTGEADDS